jgi:hypothetical protein
MSQPTHIRFGHRGLCKDAAASAAIANLFAAACEPVGRPRKLCGLVMSEPEAVIEPEAAVDTVAALSGRHPRPPEPHLSNSARESQR